MKLSPPEVVGYPEKTQALVAQLIAQPQSDAKDASIHWLVTSMGMSEAQARATLGLQTEA